MMFSENSGLLIGAEITSWCTRIQTTNQPTIYKQGKWGPD